MSELLLKKQLENKVKPDIFFLSYSESNREKNWFKLKQKHPKARRIHGIKGLSLAHRICAKLAQTEFFFIVNADNKICEDFYFKAPKETNPENLTQNYLKPAVYCWRSLNPVNGLIYGFGGVKLFPKNLFLSQPSSFIDLSTSFKGRYQIIEELASITKFNASALEAWRGAFRECVKLASECINNQKSEETEERLNIWCKKGAEKAFGKYILMGAKEGRDYGFKNKDNKKALSKINDFEWLNALFEQKSTKNNK